MIQLTMPATVRSVFGKGPMRQLRMNGKTPAVLYGNGAASLALECDAAALFKNLLFIQGRNAVVELELEGDGKDTRQVLVQEIQKDPVTGIPIHVDFLEIEIDKLRTFSVPVKFDGVARGVDMGGELRIFRDKIQLRGRPVDVPDFIKVDIADLDRGESGILLSDLEIPDNLEMLDDGAITCVTVY